MSDGVIDFIMCAGLIFVGVIMLLLIAFAVLGIIAVAMSHQ